MQAHEAKTGEARGATARPVLDDVSWDVVSRAVGSRSPAQCKQKWYGALSPSMVSRGAPSACAPLAWGSQCEQQQEGALAHSMVFRGAPFSAVPLSH